MNRTVDKLLSSATAAQHLGIIIYLDLIHTTRLDTTLLMRNFEQNRNRIMKIFIFEWHMKGSIADSQFKRIL